MNNDSKEILYVLQYAYRKGKLVLEPYPILDEARTKGPKVHLKGIWPWVGDSVLPNVVPIVFLHSTFGHLGGLEFTRKDIVELRDEIVNGPVGRYQDLRKEELNAYLLLNVVRDERLTIPENATGRLAEIRRDRYATIAVQFFRIEVEVPKELKRDAKALAKVGLL